MVQRRNGDSGTVSSLLAFLLIVAALRPALAGLLAGPVIQTWTTIAMAIVVQATPFLVLGVVLSSALATFVPERRLATPLARAGPFGVPAAALGGMLLPGCECGSVVMAGRLVATGVPSGPALAFMLSSPAINPVVLVATSVAFPGQPRMVAARALASGITATAVGFIWRRVSPPGWAAAPRCQPTIHPSWPRFRDVFLEDFAHAAGMLVIGAAATATIQANVDTRSLGAIAREPLVDIVVCALLAVALCVCSEADAFLASSLVLFSPTARLAFMVVGPAVDLKLIAMQTGTFGPRFALRFAPLTLIVAVAASAAVGTWLL